MAKYADVKNMFPKIRHLIRIDGYNNKDLIKFLGVGTATFYKWKKEYPEFNKLLRTSRDELVERMVDTFIKRAMGYYYEEIDTERIYDIVNGKKTLTREVVKTRKKYLAPSIPALESILRRMGDWKAEKNVIDADVNIINVDDKTRQLILKRIQEKKPNLIKKAKDEINS